jgi:hypothetical protein
MLDTALALVGERPAGFYAMRTVEMREPKSVKARAARRTGTTLLVLAAMLFVPGSFRFWQGWLFFLLMAGFWTFFFIDLLKSDPGLLERRLQNKKLNLSRSCFRDRSV